MKLTLWQQFSSNHSNLFHVVGVFQSIEESDFAYAEIQLFFKSSFKEQQELAAKYRVTWTKEIDFASLPHDRAVNNFEKVIEIHNTDQSWMGKTQFEALLFALGAEVAGLDEKSFGLPNSNTSVWQVEISALAPDKEALQRIEAFWEQHINTSSASFSHEELNFTHKDYFFFEHFRDFIRKLRSENCTEIDYKFEKEFVS